MLYNKNKEKQKNNKTPQRFEVFDGGLYNSKAFIPWYNKISKAFTLIELLVVIAIIGILSTLVIVSLGDSRARARDSKRINDIRAVGTALELYHANHGSYPNTITSGQPLENDGTVYLSKVPSNPTPRNDGSCPNKDYQYSYVPTLTTNYALAYCLGSGVGTVPAGVNMASPDNHMDGPLIWYKLDETSGTSAFNSGSGYTGTLMNGPVWDSGANCKLGGCLTLNGTNHYINIIGTEALTSAGPFTVMGWVKSTATSSTATGIVTKLDTTYRGWALVLEGTSYRVAYGTSDGSFGVVVMGTIDTNWHHLALTYDGATLRSYQDGNLRNTRTVTLGTNNHTIKVGPYYTNPWSSSPARNIDDIRIYNRVLTTSEINAYYNGIN